MEAFVIFMQLLMSRRQGRREVFCAGGGGGAGGDGGGVGGGSTAERAWQGGRGAGRGGVQNMECAGRGWDGGDGVRSGAAAGGVRGRDRRGESGAGSEQARAAAGAVDSGQKKARTGPPGVAGGACDVSERPSIYSAQHLIELCPRPMRRFFAARKREPAPAADAAPSSASSSSGSTDHAQITVALPTPKRTWTPWTAAKRSLSIKSSRSRTHLPPDWSNAPPLPHPASDADESDADDDDSSHLAQSPAPAPPPLDPARAQQVLRIMLANAAVLQPSVSPFTQQPDGLVYPRSINPRNRLPPPPADTRVAMLTKHLASRMHAADLSPTEIAAISPFALRPLPVVLPPTSHPHDSSRPSTTTKILPASPGLRRWIARPCFEDRYVIYYPSAAGIDVRPISSSWAIAALEYPEHLDVMVDPDFDQSPPSFNIPDHSPPLEPTLAATHSHAPTNDHALVSGIFGSSCFL